MIKFLRRFVTSVQLIIIQVNGLESSIGINKANTMELIKEKLISKRNFNDKQELLFDQNEFHLVIRLLKQSIDNILNHFQTKLFEMISIILFSANNIQTMFSNYLHSFELIYLFNGQINSMIINESMKISNKSKN